MDGKLPTANFKASILHAKKPDRESPVPIRASTFGTTTTITSNSGSITSSSPSRTTIINAAGTSDNTSPSSKELASAASTASTVSTTSTAAATASPSSKRSRLSAQPHPPSSSIPIAPITRKAKIPLVIPSAISDSPAPQDASNSLVNGDESPEGGRRQGIVFHESFQASPLPDANVKPKYPSTFNIRFARLIIIVILALYSTPGPAFVDCCLVIHPATTNPFTQQIVASTDLYFGWLFYASTLRSGRSLHHGRPS
ncbi:hypothetical protein CFO_g3252 [Ceratocystis platani]|uniref:Uncharacterized protein n=1 Tax=Ceratocystis fimbriata f. sp. platani TaxID=88771 RepID=A0A0F8B0E2_CERFI|nr:hypothetical protein CFO_g3252 [Ceratocystis platani]